MKKISITEAKCHDVVIVFLSDNVTVKVFLKNVSKS